MSIVFYSSIKDLNEVQSCTANDNAEGTDETCNPPCKRIKMDEDNNMDTNETTTDSGIDFPNNGGSISTANHNWPTDVTQNQS